MDVFSVLEAGNIYSRKNHIIIKKGGRNAHEKSFCKGAVNSQVRVERSPRICPRA